MAIRQKFPTPAPEATASYDYADIQEGSGVTIYNLAQTLISGSVSTGILIRNNIYSDGAEVSGSATAGKTSDVDYDIQFNRPQNLKGTSYLNIPHMRGATTGTKTGYLVCKVRKWDGTTETEIASATSKTISGTAGVSTGKAIHNIPIIIPLTHFKKDDTLRLTIEAWNDAADGDFAYGIDPADRTNAWFKKVQGMDTSKSTINVPFVLKT